MKNISLSVLLFLLLTGCGEHNVKKKSPVPTADLTATYQEKSYENICEVEYIPLETKENVLIHRIRAVSYISDKRIIVTNPTIGDIFIFDGKGKILYNFNHKGGGPSEYTNIRRIGYDKAKEEIFVFSYNSVKIYSEQGEYKRSWTKSGNQSFQDVLNFDEESFIAHVRSKRTDSSYLVVSKKDGAIISAVNLPDNDVIPTYVSDGKTARQSDMQQLFRDSNGFILAPISIDTVYHLNKDKQLTRLFARTPSVLNSDPPQIIMPIVVSDRFIRLLKFGAFIPGENPETEQLTYDRHEKLFYGHSYFDCSAIGGYAVRHTDFQANQFACLFDVHYIQEEAESREEGDKLKILAKSLGDDDNPVLEIITFK